MKALNLLESAQNELLWLRVDGEGCKYKDKQMQIEYLNNLVSERTERIGNILSNLRTELE